MWGGMASRQITATRNAIPRHITFIGTKKYIDEFHSTGIK